MKYYYKGNTVTLLQHVKEMTFGACNPLKENTKSKVKGSLKFGLILPHSTQPVEDIIEN